jgi:hypothetical protein
VRADTRKCAAPAAEGRGRSAASRSCRSAALPPLPLSPAALLFFPADVVGADVPEPDVNDVVPVSVEIDVEFECPVELEYPKSANALAPAGKWCWYGRGESAEVLGEGVSVVFTDAVGKVVGKEKGMRTPRRCCFVFCLLSLPLVLAGGLDFGFGVGVAAVVPLVLAPLTLAGAPLTGAGTGLGNANPRTRTGVLSASASSESVGDCGGSGDVGESDRSSEADK